MEAEGRRTLRAIKSLFVATVLYLSAGDAICAQPSCESKSLNVGVRRQALSGALKSLARLSACRIDFAAADVDGLVSNPIVGGTSIDTALQMMLRGNGLVARLRPDDSVLISPAATVQRGSIPPVIVTAPLRRFELQMAAANVVAVLTPSEWTKTPDLNVAETLGRAAGVAVLDGGYGNTNGVPVDEAARAQGNFVSLRGLDAEFNVNLINGVEAAEGRPYSRAVQLNLLPTAGLQTIVINKTATAAMDGDSIGGIIDFRTPNAFDYDQTSSASLEVTGQIQERALDYGLKGGGGGISGSFARRNDQLGVYAAAYYDQQNFANGVIDGIYPAKFNGMYVYAVQTAGGASAPGLNPAGNLVLTGVDVGVATGTTERYGGNLSFDWRSPSGNQLYIRATYAHEVTEQATSYSQIYGNNIGAVEIGSTGLYAPNIANIRPRYYYETNPEAAELWTAQIGGAFTLGRLRLSPNIFVSYGEDDEPDHIEISARLPEVAAGFPFGGNYLFDYNNGVPIAKLDAAELAAVSNVAAYGARRSGELTVENSRQTKGGVKLDAVYAASGRILKEISFGAKFISSSRFHSNRDYTSQLLFSGDADDPSFGSLGILQGAVPVVAPGAYDFSLPLVNQGKLFKLFDAAIQKEFGSLTGASDQCGSLYVNSNNCDTQRGSEDVESVYALAKVNVGDIEITPGIRYEHTKINNIFWVISQDQGSSDLPGAFASNSSRYSKVLPSVRFTYRPTPSSVYRFELWKSYVLPAFFQLGGGAQIVNSGGGAANGGATTITEGNPNLKAIDSTNVDISAGWIGNRANAVSISVFYKSIHNYIFDSVNGYTRPTAVNIGSTIITMPENGGDGHVFGVELGLEKRFNELRPPFDGFGLAGNVTIERSSVDSKSPGLSPHERLLDQPDLTANAQLSYKMKQFDVAVSYHYTSNYIAEYATLGPSSDLDTWVQARHDLDLEFGYHVRTNIEVNFLIGNLLAAESYVASIGEHSRLITSRVESGRTCLFKVRVNY